MLTSTLDGVPGYRVVEHLGLVQGSTVRTKHLGRDIMASVKELVGGELRGYTELLNEAREEAVARMCAAAEELGADAILSIRFGAANIGGKAAEILVYGTAVRLSPGATPSP
ncbi:YbjQ family protein [Niveispirillum irakense]|uniref:YbjQ family protein n=1 Tax=Niveispirillum irakense TaxID=34011 RepID=UPI00042544EA|nr:YbjQ family protein [Niveispirillum irakense]